MKKAETLKQKIARVVKEKVDIVPYDSIWPKMFEEEARFLHNKFPTIIKRIEHFGSTAVPGLASKPIIDILVEVTSSEDAKKKIAPVLEKLGYDYFWRPEFDKPPMYAWFIKRSSKGKRTHHIHMVERGSELWERILFRNYLRKYPEKAKTYADLKLRLSTEYPNDRVAYTRAKDLFVAATTLEAKKYFQTKTSA